MGDLKMPKQAKDIPSAIRVSVTNMILHQLTLHNNITTHVVPHSLPRLPLLRCDVLRVQLHHLPRPELPVRNGIAAWWR